MYWRVFALARNPEAFVGLVFFGRVGVRLRIVMIFTERFAGHFSLPVFSRNPLGCD